MNQKTTYIILSLLMVLAVLRAGMAQTPQLNEEKYWNYRDRLKNEFLIAIGPGMGMSIPASVRDTVNGVLQWTDCTMALGEYIGVLATEYRILETRSNDTEETVEELFYALYALNRLDFTAEPFFAGTASLNGFFMRDDISEDSLDMDEVLAHLNQGLPEHKITSIDSDYMDENPRNNEESLDQAILLITGLVLVRKCVPEDVVYLKDNVMHSFQDFETSLSLEAGNIIRRIVNYMKEGNPVIVQLDPSDPNLYGIQGEAWDFMIKNPVTMVEVLRGPNAFFLSKGFTSAKYHAIGEYSETTDTVADWLTDSIFLLIEDHILPNDQDFKAINLNAMANFWPDALQADTTNTDYNAQVLGPRSQLQAYEWVPMLHQLVFGGDKNYLMSQVPPDTAFFNNPQGYYENLLNQAPPEGPYNYGNGNYPGWEWSSTSRTLQPGRRGELSTSFTGNYSGLDYMLYYNMFTILFSEHVMLAEEESTEISIYPNPFMDILKIANMQEGTNYRISDAAGRVIHTGSLPDQGTHTIDTGGWQPGMYILSVRGKDNFVISRKIIKQQP